jgi:ribosome-associated heat shock protein Hsp15
MPDHPGQLLIIRTNLQNPEYTFFHMPDNENIRIDKFLWAVRIFKTRSLASEACRKGKVIINNVQVKPSRIAIAGETISVKKLPLIYKYLIIKLIENRVSAREVPFYINDITPEEEKARLINKDLSEFGYRDKGTGRPTKKERRTIDKLKKDHDNS